MCTSACNLTLNNTGEVSCPSVFDVSTGFFLVPLVADDGTENFLDVSAFTPNPATYISGKVNHADASKRWYPVQNIKNIVNERGEPTFQEFEDQTQYYVRQGVRRFTGLKPKVSSRWVKSLDGLRCSPKFGLFLITSTNGLVGKRISDTNADMYPIEIDKQTFVATFVPATNTTVQAANITFQFATSEKDGDLVMISADDMGTARLSTYNGLLDVLSTVSNESTTGFTIELYVLDGNIISNVPVTGLVVGDLALYNVTDSASITPSSLTETSDGVYDVVMPAQTSADVVRVTFTKNGYDFSAVTASTVLVP